MKNNNVNLNLFNKKTTENTFCGFLYFTLSK